MTSTPTHATIAENPALVALVAEVRGCVLRYTDTAGALRVTPSEAWSALALIALREIARHSVPYAVATMMLYRAYRDQEERDGKVR